MYLSCSSLTIIYSLNSVDGKHRKWQAGLDVNIQLLQAENL